MSKSVAYIGMGSNLGDQAGTLMRAMMMLDQADGVSVRKVSQLIRTEAVGGPADQPPYFNGVAQVETTLSPPELLAVLQGIEAALGRDRAREQRWGARTCDLDLLLADELVLDSPELTLPHPRMHLRAFVLEPLASIAPEAVHPVLGRTAAQLLADLRAGVTAEPAAPAGRDAQARLISVIGPVAAGKTTLAELLAMELPAALVTEDFAGNPFLADSYEGQAAARFPAQLYYLVSRVKQLAKGNWPAGGLVVADYGLCQDRVFAKMRLTGEEFALYEQVWSRLSPMAHPADLMISLEAPEAELLGRISRRGRAFEASIDAEFLARQREAYEQVVEQASCPVLRIDAGLRDLRSASVRADLVRSLREMLA